MRIHLGCNTQRGVKFLERVLELADPQDSIFVTTTPETPGEPKYVADLDRLCHRSANVSSFAYNGNLGLSEGADLLMLVNWRRWVPPAEYKLARTAVCFHDSLLPRYRGFYPAVWAMLNGDKTTGVTLFHLAPGIDAGPIIAQRELEIGPDDTIREVVDGLTDRYLGLLDEYWGCLRGGSCPGRPQDQSRATYTCQRVRGDDEIDWRAPVHATLRKIRALTRPYQGAWTTLDGRPLIVWSARPHSKVWEGIVPGAVVSRIVGDGALVLTGTGAIELLEVEAEGFERKPAGSVLEPTQRLGY